jgi:DNA-binding Xre family transcriptional regulator
MKLAIQEKQRFLTDVKRHMAERRWNASRLARESEIHQSQVSRILSGYFETLGSNIIKICMILGMEPKAYHSATRADEDRLKIADTALSIWDGTRRDTEVVVSLLREIAKMRKHSARR